MPPEARILGLGAELPGRGVSNAELAGSLGTDGEAIARRSGVEWRYHASPGEGPSDLALRAAQGALAEAGTSAADLGLIVFATATPDVCFPGAACFLQHKLGAPTVGSIDVRAQSAGFLCALDFATAYASVPAKPRSDAGDPRYAHVLIAAGEVISSGLDRSPNGVELTPRFGDGVAVAVVGWAERGARVRALHWYTDGSLAERFWCEYPASRRYPMRVTVENLRAGQHYPRADLGGLAATVADRLVDAGRAALKTAGLEAREIDAALVDYVDPAVARSAATALDIRPERLSVPTAEFGHVMAGGLPIGLDRRRRELGAGARVLLAAAGPGLSWGAAVLEL